MTRSMRFGGWKLLPACLLLAGCAGVPLGSNPNQSEETALRQLEHSRIAAGDAMRSTQAAFQILAQNIAYSDIPAYKALRAELAPGGKVKVHVDLRQGELTPTDQDMDVAIRGDGFFKVIWRTPDGREVVAYTREGAFFTDSNGQFQLHNAGSYKLDPPVSIPGNTMVITITPDGKVLVTLSGNPTPNWIGQIQLAVFAHPDELEYRDGFFWETNASGAPDLWNPGSVACGTLVQRSMERSNVVVNEEMAYLVKLSRWNQKLRQDLGLPVTQQAVGSTRETNPYLKLALAGLTQARETAQRNLANARTVGYKYETPLIHEGGVVQIRRNFARGEFAITGHELDVAIDGDGFFQVKLGEGDKLGYTRAGSLIVSKDGYLCSPAGYLLEPPVAIPADATAIMIGVDGRMLVTPAVNPTPVPVGQIQLARFVNPQGLAVKDGIYSVTEASGLPIVCNPGLEGTGMLKQGALEMSNVSLNQEWAQLSTLDYWQQVLEEAEKLAPGALTNSGMARR